jgi:hypothetical protein
MFIWGRRIYYGMYTNVDEQVGRLGLMKSEGPGGFHGEELRGLAR